MNWQLPVSLCALAFTLWVSGVFGLAERFRRRHLRPVVAGYFRPTMDPAAALKEEHDMAHELNVAALLGRAAGAAEALTDCGIETDDAQLVAEFIEGTEKTHADFIRAIRKVQGEHLAHGIPASDLAPIFEAVQQSMQISPAYTTAWYMWRLASALKAMAGPDVLEAARELVAYLQAQDDTQPQNPPLNKAVAKLAAALPKEG